ncbi:MAG: hypothetical protein ACK40G_02945 [Cytophagaceae bacterium]
MQRIIWLLVFIFSSSIVAAQSIELKAELKIDSYDPLNAAFYARGRELPQLIISGVKEGKLKPLKKDYSDMPVKEFLQSVSFTKDSSKLFSSRDFHLVLTENISVYAKEKKNVPVGLSIILPANHPHNNQGQDKHLATFKLTDVKQYLYLHPKAAWYNPYNHADSSHFPQALEQKRFRIDAIALYSESGEMIADLKELTPNYWVDVLYGKEKRITVNSFKDTSSYVKRNLLLKNIKEYAEDFQELGREPATMRVPKEIVELHLPFTSYRYLSLDKTANSYVGFNIGDEVLEAVKVGKLPAFIPYTNKTLNPEIFRSKIAESTSENSGENEPLSGKHLNHVIIEESMNAKARGFYNYEIKNILFAMPGYEDSSGVHPDKPLFSIKVDDYSKWAKNSKFINLLDSLRYSGAISVTNSFGEVIALNLDPKLHTEESGLKFTLSEIDKFFDNLGSVAVRKGYEFQLKYVYHYILNTAPGKLTSFDNIELAKRLPENTVELQINNPQKLSDPFPKLDKFVNLYELALSDMGNVEIPKAIGALQKMEFMFIENCPDLSYSKLFTQLAKIKKLRFLQIKSSGVTVFPNELSWLSGLWTVEVINNPGLDLGKLFFLLAQLPEVKILNLSGNEITELPSTIAQIRTLEELNLAGNSIKTLPVEIARLKKLKKLSIDGSNMTQEEKDKISKLLPNVDIDFN